MINIKDTGLTVSIEQILIIEIIKEMAALYQWKRVYTSCNATNCCKFIRCQDFRCQLGEKYYLIPFNGPFCTRIELPGTLLMYLKSNFLNHYNGNSEN